MKTNLGFKRLAVLFAFLAGTVVYKVISKILDKFLCYLFNMKTLGPFDEFWLYDDKKSLSNIGLLMGSDKFTFE